MALEIVVDEAWTHGGDIGRYWCFYGALFGESAALKELEAALAAIKAEHGHKQEVKWSSLTFANEALYKELVDAVLLRIRDGKISFRQMFYDRALVRLPNHVYEEELSELDVQFRLCYQFLKHAFGLKSLANGTAVRVMLDTHSSKKHRVNLDKYATGIPNQLRRGDLRLAITFHRSSSMMCLQLVDLFIGAAGFHGNQMYLRRENGAKRISKKQALKRDFAKMIYCGLREISNDERGAKGFNWFESTGKGGIAEPRHYKKIDIWKFKPAVYQMDKGWENDHLVKGRYVAPDFDGVVRRSSVKLW